MKSKTWVIIACTLGIMGTVTSVGKSVEFAIAVHDERIERLHNDSIMYYFQQQETEDSMRDLMRCPCWGDSIHMNQGNISQDNPEYFHISAKHWEEGVGWKVDPLDPIR